MLLMMAMQKWQLWAVKENGLLEALRFEMALRKS